MAANFSTHRQIRSKCSSRPKSGAEAGDNIPKFRSKYPTAYLTFPFVHLTDLSNATCSNLNVCCATDETYPAPQWGKPPSHQLMPPPFFQLLGIKTLESCLTSLTSHTHAQSSRQSLGSAFPLKANLAQWCRIPYMIQLLTSWPSFLLLLMPATLASGLLLKHPGTTPLGRLL